MMNTLLTKLTPKPQTPSSVHSHLLESYDLHVSIYIQYIDLLCIRIFILIIHIFLCLCVGPHSDTHSYWGHPFQKSSFTGCSLILGAMMGGIQVVTCCDPNNHARTYLCIH